MPPAPERYVISWFGYDLRDFELFEESEFQQWAYFVERLAATMNMRVERLGNPLDIIVGKNTGSVSHQEFYHFQQKWNEMNEQLGFRMSGVLWLMQEGGDSSISMAGEFYRYGRIEFGNSIGRPHCHSLRSIRRQPPT